MRSNPTVRLGGDRNECAGCGQLFNSSAAFDKHREGYFDEPRDKGPTVPRHCLTADEMKEKGMLVNAAGFWIGSARVWESNMMAAIRGETS